MKNWTEYTDKDSEHLYDGSFDLEAELNCTEPARDVPKMTPSTDSQQVRELSEQLQKMTAAFKQSQAEQKNIYKKFQSAEERHREVLNKTKEELKQQVQANDDLNKEVMRQKRDKELYQMRLNNVEKTLKFQGQNNQHFKKATERKQTETIRELEVEFRKVREARKVQLDETKQDLQNTQEELKHQVQEIEGLKMDVKRERAEKEMFQIRNSHLEKNLKIQRQNVEDLKKEVVETQKVLEKTREELQQQVLANEGLNKELMLQKRDKELFQMRLNDVEKTLKFQDQNNQHLQKATEKKLTETINELEVEIIKVKEASKIELDETKRVLQDTQEELKQQVQAIEGLKKDVKREQCEKGMFQILHNHLEKNLKIQRQNVEDLKKELNKEKEDKEAIETQRKELAECLNEKLDGLEEVIRKEKQEKSDIQAELEKALEQTAALRSQLNKERAKFETESTKDKEACETVVKEKEELLERIQLYSNNIESQQHQVQELSAALGKVEVEKENLTSALKITEELREQTGAALEQLVQLYDKKMSKRRFWRRR